jgi:hypothetical protein
MKEKNINIDINIENNLMSKNKIPKGENDMPSVKNAPTVQHKYMYNPGLPREVNEYYGIMAAKKFYENTSSISGQNPVNLNNYIGHTPVTPSTIQPTSSISNSSQPEQGIPPTDVSSTEYNPSFSVDNNPSFPEVQKTGGFNILDDAQDTEYMNNLNESERRQRRRYIKQIENTDDIPDNKLTFRKATIQKWNLGRYIMEHRSELWDKILNAPT